MEGLIPHIGALVIGYLADLIFADPENMPHPVRGYGRLISGGEKLLNKRRFRWLKGMVLSVVLISATFIIFYLIDHYVLRHNMWLKMLAGGVFVYWGLANQTLIREVSQVFKKLEQGLVPARRQLSRIVGRDTTNLNEQQVKQAALESLSENLSDGVIGPLFFYALLGIPGIMTYKMINTLDSMVGYRNDRYEAFGKFAAKLDDIVNFIPSRLTVLLLSLASLDVNALRYAYRFGSNHKSPNAGYPEAALAGILNCRFGGANSYGGMVVEKPYIGENEKSLSENDLSYSLWLNHAATLLMVICIIVIDLILTW